MFTNIQELRGKTPIARRTSDVPKISYIFDKKQGCCRFGINKAAMTKAGLLAGTRAVVEIDTHTKIMRIRPTMNGNGYKLSPAKPNLAGKHSYAQLAASHVDPMPSYNRCVYPKLSFRDDCIYLDFSTIEV